MMFKELFILLFSLTEISGETWKVGDGGFKKIAKVAPTARSISTLTEPNSLLDIPACTFVNQEVQSCKTVTKPKCRIVSKRGGCATNQLATLPCRKTKTVRKCNRKMSKTQCRSLCRNKKSSSMVTKCKVTFVCEQGGHACGEREVCYDRPVVADSDDFIDIGKCVSEQCQECREVEVEYDEGCQQSVVSLCGGNPAGSVVEERVCREVEEEECGTVSKPVLVCDEVLRVPLSRSPQQLQETQELQQVLRVPLSGPQKLQELQETQELQQVLRVPLSRGPQQLQELQETQELQQVLRVPLSGPQKLQELKKTQELQQVARVPLSRVSQQLQELHPQQLQELQETQQLKQVA